MKKRVCVGTRGSTLALAQTREIIELLTKSVPGIHYEIVPIHTRGDRTDLHGTTRNEEGKSIFTSEIEDELIKGTIDLAVHSLKDLATEEPKGVVIGAVPQRANPHDVLVSRQKLKFNQLPGRARIGTSSPRRKAQLLSARSDLEVQEIEGNVDTRLRKLANGQYDAIILAAAGLTRLGLEKHATEVLSSKIMLSAVGQGALAIQCREDDDEIVEHLKNIEHEPTRKAVEAERAFACQLGADCRTPVAAYAKIESSKLTIEGLVAATNGTMVMRSRLVSEKSDAQKAGRELATLLLKQGAAAILEAP